MPLLHLPDHLTDVIPEADKNAADAIRVPAEDIPSLFGYLSDSYPEAARQLFESDGTLKQNLILVHNDQVVPRPRVDSVTLAADDSITLLLHFAGG